jgi:hypothetical protein
MAPAQAFIVDDFNTTNTYACQDPANPTACPTTTGIDNGNTVWGETTNHDADTTRTLDAMLAPGQGDSVTIEVCSNCQTAHITAASGAPPSRGDYWFTWTGDSVNLGSLSSFVFDWGADHPGTRWFADFDDGSGVVNTVPQPALPATPGPGSLTHTASVAIPTQFTQLVQVSLHFDGVPALDANIDNVRLVPEPSVLALLSVGLLGLGWQRRRRAG